MRPPASLSTAAGNGLAMAAAGPLSDGAARTAEESPRWRSTTGTVQDQGRDGAMAGLPGPPQRRRQAPGRDRGHGGVRPERPHQGRGRADRRRGLRRAGAGPLLPRAERRGRLRRAARGDPADDRACSDDTIVADMARPSTYLQAHDVRARPTASASPASAWAAASPSSPPADAASRRRRRSTAAASAACSTSAAKISCPMLLFFGDQDAFIPNDEVAQHPGRRWRELGKDAEVKVYPGAPHGFFCDERDSYRRRGRARTPGSA